MSLAMVDMADLEGKIYTPEGTWGKEVQESQIEDLNDYVAAMQIITT